MIDKASEEERRALAAGAKDLLTDKAFQAAVLALRQQWHSDLMNSSNEYQDRALKAKMQALETIGQQLQIYINNQVKAEKRYG